MNLDNFNISNNQSEITEIFKKIINQIKNTYSILNIDTNDMYIYYQRLPDKTSILALKVNSGDSDDKSNYMFTGCNPSYYDNKVFCEVYMHADAKSAKNTIDISRLISKDIVNFFKELEQVIYNNNELDKELSIIIPLENQSEIVRKATKSKKISKSRSKIIDKFKTIFK